MSDDDALGRALADHHADGPAGELLYRDGGTSEPHDVRETYFAPPSVAWRRWLASLEGPVLDAGCGAGRDARWLQRDGKEVVAVDRSRHAVETARDRGVDAAAVMDMFGLAFADDRFRSAIVIGTQAGLAGSLAGIRSFLAGLARVTTPDGVVIVDSYDPERLDPSALLGYRPDPRVGVARRRFHFEYRTPDGERVVGPSLGFVLVSPDRLRDVAVGTSWSVEAVRPRDGYYRARLEK